MVGISAIPLLPKPRLGCGGGEGRSRRIGAEVVAHSRVFPIGGSGVRVWGGAAKEGLGAPADDRSGDMQRGIRLGVAIHVQPVVHERGTGGSCHNERNSFTSQDKFHH